MPRVGPTPEKVVERAAVLADERGYEEVSLAALGESVGEQKRGAAVRALAAAYRKFARDHPGLYAATVRAPAPDDVAHTAQRARGEWSVLRS